jgi:hypothetical protein
MTNTLVYNKSPPFDAWTYTIKNDGKSCKLVWKCNTEEAQASEWNRNYFRNHISKSRPGYLGAQRICKLGRPKYTPAEDRSLSKMHLEHIGKATM